jgi:S-phase kinase-associated protein 1
MATEQQQQQITLHSNDEREFKVSKKVAVMSVTIKNMLEDLEGTTGENPIPLPNVTGKTLEKVLAYCQHKIDHPSVVADTATSKDEKESRKVEEMTEWDKQYLQVDQASLFELILAANYLDIKPLLDLTCTAVANMIKGKTPEEIRKQFNIKNDFTPEEEEQVRKENEWCEDK